MHVIQTLMIQACSMSVTFMYACKCMSHARYMHNISTPKDPAESALQALKLIGNASAPLSAERHKKATTCLNKELSTLVDQEHTFVEATTFLFAPSFQKKIKEHMEAIRNLKQAPTLYGHVHGQSYRSPRAVAAATGLGVRENPRLENNKCMSFKQINKRFKHYKCSKSCNRCSELAPRVHFDEGSQGADTPSINLMSVSIHISTIFKEAQSTGVRGLTANPPSKKPLQSQLNTPF